MKITCEYCGNTFNDTESQCPYCGSPSKGVQRQAQKDPKTIEELKQWYADRGLPPAETTRFFIGVDYKQPRAFGIFKDEATGVCTVYKNKDTGERAIRYQGTDEAYAVNELLQRLKQEILQQKAHAINKSAGGGSSRSVGSKLAGAASVAGKGIAYSILTFFGFSMLAIVFMLIVGVCVMTFDNEPNEGYYRYNDTTYYYDLTDYRGVENQNWYSYDEASGEWTGPYDRGSISDEMNKNRKAKKYFLQEEWDQSLPCTNFADTEYASDIAADFTVPVGYYNYNNDIYYHMNGSWDYGWYTYSDNDWTSVDSEYIPDDLTHSDKAQDFYYTPTWDSSTQYTDFTTTQEYQDEVNAEESWDDSSSDSDYDWSSSSDSWDSGSTDWGSDW